MEALYGNQRELCPGRQIHVRRVRQAPSHEVGPKETRAESQSLRTISDARSIFPPPQIPARRSSISGLSENSHYLSMTYLAIPRTTPSIAPIAPSICNNTRVTSHLSKRLFSSASILFVRFSILAFSVASSTGSIF